MDKSFDNIFGRRVAKILPDENGLRKLMRQRKIRLYQGFDPTAPKLHLGHAIGMKKLMDFANAGHEVIFLFGTGTVLAGDPSLREEARKLISQGQIDENIKNWQRQASTVVDFNKVTIKQNGEWLAKMTLSDIIKVGSKLSAVQLFKRESFTRRIKTGSTVWFHETMYPMLQGYDSVVMDVDLEIGGTDQEFNMLVGRELQRKMNNKEKYVLETPMIMGTDGRPMSKSSGNCVWLDDTPEEKFGKLMALDDSSIVDYLMHCTDMPLNAVRSKEEKLKSGVNPRDIKLAMAWQVVMEMHSSDLADSARESWERQFSQGKMPEKIPTVNAIEGDNNIIQLVVEAGLASSNSEARRLLGQGGIRKNGEQLEVETVEFRPGDIVQVGKRRFVRIVKK